MKNEQTRIMIVDDNQAFTDGISLLLESEGYICHPVNDPRTTFKMLEKENSDILLIDWQMPEMSGVELMQRLRSLPEHQRKYIIMVSGKDTIEDKVVGMDAGADDYLTKPVETPELLARIRAALRILKLEKELIEQERKNTVLEMALSISDKIGNPLAAARLLQKYIQGNAQKDSTISQSVEDLGTVLLEIQELLKKYQSIKNPRTIPSVMGKRMIDPDSENEGGHSQESD
jgi:sigma-B regulation protein RsbU (phosphoserine phosphatase)